MHGCNHLYTQKSDKNDIFNYGSDSKFYGLDYSKQFDKIGWVYPNLKKSQSKEFFAPNHIYDQNTLEALKKKNIKIIIDGYGLFPFTKMVYFLFLNCFTKRFFYLLAFKLLNYILTIGAIKTSKDLKIS